MTDKPLSRTRYDRRAIPPAVVAFQWVGAASVVAGDEQMKDQALEALLFVYLYVK